MRDGKPLAIDLYCGLGGWAEGLLAEGWRVVGYDIEAHDYGKGSYPGELVIQDVLTLNGSQFKDASLIVASPPCQEFSYMAMPWSRAKEKARKYESGELDVADLTRLFDACFRIQREAIEAAGHHIPMIVENVRGAQKWVGKAKGKFGSYYLWGDVPALMPKPLRAKLKTVGPITAKQADNYNCHINEMRDCLKVPGFRFDGSGKSFQSASVELVGASHETRGVKIAEKDDDAGTKMGGDWFSDPTSTCRRHGSKSSARKAASAMIAKIPTKLSQHIAVEFKPRADVEVGS